MKKLNLIFKNILRCFTSGSERSVVVICFLLSTLFWVLIKFSKAYTYYIDYPIEIVNQPIEKYLKEVPQTSLKLKVKGFGFNFLKETFIKRTIKVDVSKLSYLATKESYYWITESKIPEMAIELSGFSILEIEPDFLGRAEPINDLIRALKTNPQGFSLEDFVFTEPMLAAIRKILPLEQSTALRAETLAACKEALVCLVSAETQQRLNALALTGIEENIQSAATAG